jgi:hemerythrin superfamily protein
VLTHNNKEVMQIYPKVNTNQVEDTAIRLTKFLDEFKGLFNQLLQQNSMILNMLTMLINESN